MILGLNNLNRSSPKHTKFREEFQKELKNTLQKQSFIKHKVQYCNYQNKYIY